MLNGAGLRQVRGRAKGFWAAKVLSVSAKAGALIWHRHFNLKKVIHELKRAADEVPCGLLQGPHAAVLAVQCEAEHCPHDVLHCNPVPNRRDEVDAHAAQRVTRPPGLRRTRRARTRAPRRGLGSRRTGVLRRWCRWCRGCPRARGARC